MPAKRTNDIKQAGCSPLEAAMLNAAFHTGPDGIIVVDPNGKTILYNSQFVKMWGIPEETIKTRDNKKMIDFALTLVTDPKSFLEKIDYLYKNESVESFDKIFLKDGRVFNRYSSPLTGENEEYFGRIFYFRDMTEYFVEHKQLEASEQKFKSLFESVGDRIYILSENGKILEANRAAWEKLGYDKEQLLKMTIRDINSPHTRPFVPEKIKLVKKYGTAVFQTEHMTRSGDVIPVEINSKTINFEGEAAFLAACRDLDENKRLHEYEELNRIKDEFLNIAAHELRTPLTSIVGMSEVVAQNNPSLPEKYVGYLNIIRDEGMRLARIIKQMLEVARYENDRPVQNMKPLVLNKLLLDLKPVMDAIARRKNAKIVVNIPKGDISVKSDKEKISQVVFDLVDNAVKFGPKGQTVAVSLVRADKNNAKIMIADHGQGIPYHLREKIFTKFSQLDSSLSRTEEGLGLGLYVCKLIIEKLGGQIGVDPVPGDGSEFWFTLPL